MSVKRERSSIERERSSVERASGEVPPVGDEIVLYREGRDLTQRFNSTPDPDEYRIGTCRICEMGSVVLVRLNNSRGNPDVRAFCMFCNRPLDPHEVERG